MASHSSEELAVGSATDGGSILEVSDTVTPSVEHIDLRPEVSVWCDPAELADIARRKSARKTDAEAAGELLELARGDRATVREAMEYAIDGEPGADTQRALRLLFAAYQLASSY